MDNVLRVLVIEDSADDADLTLRELRKHHYEVEALRVQSREATIEALTRYNWDVVIADYSIPGFSGTEALELVKSRGLDVPFILVSGTIATDVAVSAMKAGAHDYIIKDDLRRLGPAVERELREARTRRDRARAFRALRRSEERFRAAVERSLHAFFVLESVRDSDGRVIDFAFTYLNTRAQELLGRRRPEVLGKTLCHILPRLAGRGMVERYANVVETGSALDGELAVNNTELSAEWIHQLVVPLSDGVAVTMADISRRKKTEWELDRFFSMSAGLLAITGVDDYFKRVNPAFERVLGWSEKQLLSRPHLEIVHPDDLEMTRAAFTRARTGEWVDDFENRIRCRDGTYRSIAWTVTAAEQEVYCVGHDVTERRRAAEALRASESRYRAIVEDQTELICRFRPDGELTFVNGAYARWFDSAPEHLVGNSFYSMIPLRHREELAAALAEVERHGRGHDFEISLTLPDGTTCWQEWTVRALHDATGQTVEFQAVGRDISEHRRAIEERARLESELRHAQKMEAMGTLASGVAHDFSNLLTVIHGYTDLAAKLLPENHPALGYLQTIEKVATRATGVTNSLLTFSQRKAVEKRPVDLAPLVSESVRLLRRLIPRSITMREHIPEEGVWVEGDEAQLQQVVMNFALNARDAMPEGGKVRIEVRRDRDSDGQPIGVLVVADTGQGMDERTRGRIFEPFFTTKPRGEGTGLGLSIVHGIVADHDGSVHVESAPGEGTRFTVKLPAIEQPAELSPQTPAPPATGAAGESVLVVEDDAFVRSLIVSTLDEEGFNVIEAGDGIEAIERMKEVDGRIDLVVLDMDLPRMTGTQVLKHLRQDYVRLPVIVITGNPTQQMDAAGAGGNGHDNGNGNGNGHGHHEDAPPLAMLHKPFQMSTLLQTISHILGTSRQQEIAI